MTLILNSKDVEQAINMRTIIDQIEKGLVEEYNGHVQVPARVNLPTNNNGFFRLMPAVLNESGYMGFKVFFKSGANNKSSVRYLIGVIDQNENNLEAMMDSHYLTAVRTGATTGLATKYLARENATTVGVIGSGLEARTNLEAVCVWRCGGASSPGRRICTHTDKVCVVAPQPYGSKSLIPGFININTLRSPPLSKLMIFAAFCIWRSITSRFQIYGIGFDFGSLSITVGAAIHSGSNASSWTSR